jgi:hypothetical protein
LKPPVNDEPDFDLDTFELDLSAIDIDLDIDPSEFGRRGAQKLRLLLIETVATAPVIATPEPVIAAAEPVVAAVEAPPVFDIPEFDEVIARSRKVHPAVRPVDDFRDRRKPDGNG